MALDGHLVVKTVDDVSNLICYIPEIVTDNQCMWFSENMDMIQKYIVVGGYGVNKKDNSYETVITEDFHQLLRLINKRNLLYNKLLVDKKLTSSKK